MFFTVLVNHEQMLIHVFRDDPCARYRSHGAGWWLTIAAEMKGMIAELEKLPIVIEIESARGIVGVVHADVPAGVTWSEFVASLGDPQIEEFALWGRDRLKKRYTAGVEGIWRVCCGHTWFRSLYGWVIFSHWIAQEAGRARWPSIASKTTLSMWKADLSLRGELHDGGFRPVTILFSDAGSQTG